LLEQLIDLVENCRARVVTGDQVGQVLGDLLPNRLVLCGFFRGKPAVAGNAFYGRCLLNTKTNFLKPGNPYLSNVCARRLVKTGA
jgi:hypothetical protein